MLVARALPAKNFCIKTRKISVAIPLICIYYYTISAQKTALNQRFLCLPMKNVFPAYKIFVPCLGRKNCLPCPKYAPNPLI